jgi:hypothetical protein
MQSEKHNLIIDNPWVRKGNRKWLILCEVVCIYVFVVGSINLLDSNPTTLYATMWFGGIILSLYIILALILNSTVIVVSTNKIMKYFNPLPWFGCKEISTIEIRTLFIKKITNTGEGGDIVFFYNICCELTNKKVVTLLSIQSDLNKAIKYVTEIHDWLCQYHSIELVLNVA